MVHILEGRLKLANKEADGERALNQVAESTFQEKIQELAHMEQRAKVAERARDSSKWKVEVLKGKLEDLDFKIAKAINMV